MLAGVSHSNSVDTLADFEGPLVDSLPVLHPQLRPTLSMSELECRGSADHQSLKHSDHLSYTLGDFDMVEGATYSLDAAEARTTGGVAVEACAADAVGAQGKERPRKLSQQSASPTTSSKNSRDSKQSGSDTSHECTFSGTSWTPPGDTRTHRAATDDLVTGHRTALLWGETHSHAAGELFYTTFQHAAAIASPKRSVHS